MADPLLDLLSMPRGARKRRHAWRQFTTGDTLFTVLQSAVRNGEQRNYNHLQELIERWKTEYLDYLKEGQENELLKWNIVRRLLWCAKQAAASPNRSKMDRVLSNFKESKKPEYIKPVEEWAAGCIQTFLGGFGTDALNIPVALWEPKKDTAFIATLVLEVLEGPLGEAGKVFHHPIDAFAGRFDEEFNSSMEHAWKTATQIATRSSETSRYDGRWRLLQEDGPVPEVAGRSASGAAARGWWFALGGQIPDEGVIVLAQIDRNGILEGVDSVPAKVQAIVLDGRFDTVVVASDKNQREAEEVLRENHMLNRIRVERVNAR